MSDFSISQVLILVLLLPALLRPFSKNLKAVSAIPVFPFAALFVFCLVILAYSFFISLIPIFLLILICIITDFSKFVMLVNNLPNNYYSVFGSLIRAFLLVILSAAFFSVFYFSPEHEYKIVSGNFVDEPIQINHEGKNITCGFSSVPENLKNENTVILVFTPFQKAGKMRSTLTRYFIDKGYKTIELTNNLQSEKFYMFKMYYRLFNFDNLLFNIKYSKPKLNEHLLNSIILNILNDDDNTEIYVISEGLYNKELYNYSVKNPNRFAGIFFIASENEDDFLPGETACFLNEIQGFQFSMKQSEFRYCVMVRPKEKLPVCGEMRCEDILAAILLNSSRDIGRTDRIKAASVFEKWVQLKTEIIAITN